MILCAEYTELKPVSSERFGKFTDFSSQEASANLQVKNEENIHFLRSPDECPLPVCI